MEAPEPLAFPAAARSRRKLSVLVVASVVVVAVFVGAVLLGVHVLAFGTSLLYLPLFIWSGVRNATVVNADGVRVAGRKGPIPWSDVEAFRPSVRGGAFVRERGRAKPWLLRGARERDLPALRAWLEWARSS